MWRSLTALGKSCCVVWWYVSEHCCIFCQMSLCRPPTPLVDTHVFPYHHSSILIVLFLSFQIYHSIMFIQRSRTFSLTSSSVIRRGTPVWTKRTQSLHRLKRNRRNSAPVRKESSLSWSWRWITLCWLLLLRTVTTVNLNQKVTASSSLTILMRLRVKIRMKGSMETQDQVEIQSLNQMKGTTKPEVPVRVLTNLTSQRLTVIVIEVNSPSNVTVVGKTLNVSQN